MTLDPRMGVVDPALRVLGELGLTLRERTSLSPLARAVLLGVPIGELRKYRDHAGSVDECGRTALRYAVEMGSLDAVKELLDNLQASVDLADAQDVTPLHVAAARGDSEMVDLLLLTAKNTCPVDKIRGETPLVGACRNMNWHLVERLAKAEASRPDFTGRTALHWIMLKASSLSDCMEAVNHLLKCQVNVNAQDNQGRAPLHFAAERGMSDACGVLVKHGAKLNVTDEKGETPLHRSIIKPSILQGKTCVLQALLDLKADPLIKRQDGKTVEDILVNSLALGVWNDSQRIALEVALRRVKKALETTPK